MGTGAACYGGAEGFLASSEWPPVRSEVECLGKADLSCLLGFRVFGLQHGVILAEVFACVNGVCPLSGL
jgi:hypothetical protein